MTRNGDVGVTGPMLARRVDAVEEAGELRAPLLAMTVEEASTAPGGAS